MFNWIFPEDEEDSEPVEAEDSGLFTKISDALTFFGDDKKLLTDGQSEASGETTSRDENVASVLIRTVTFGLISPSGEQLASPTSPTSKSSVYTGVSPVVTTSDAPSDSAEIEGLKLAETPHSNVPLVAVSTLGEGSENQVTISSTVVISEAESPYATAKTSPLPVSTDRSNPSPRLTKHVPMDEPSKVDPGTNIGGEVIDLVTFGLFKADSDTNLKRSRVSDRPVSAREKARRETSKAKVEAEEFDVLETLSFGLMKTPRS